MRIVRRRGPELDARIVAAGDRWVEMDPRALLYEILRLRQAMRDGTDPDAPVMLRELQRYMRRLFGVDDPRGDQLTDTERRRR